MLERPDLPDATILACVRASYGIPVVGIDILPANTKTPSKENSPPFGKRETMRYA